jgi:hypothetical protein
MLALTRIGWAQAQEVFVGRRHRRLGRRNFRSRACVYLTTPEGVRCLTTCARVSFFPFYKPQEGKWRVVGGAPMSIWLFIYLFKYRGRERTNTRRTTGEKREFFFLYLKKKTKRWAQHLDTRVQESAEEPFFFFLFLFSYFFFSIFLLVSPPSW